MVTSRFQLGLIATLAVGLGFSLSSSEAIGYPAGAAVSLGANPLVSATGNLTTLATEEAFASSEGQQLILTDIILTQMRSSGCSSGSVRKLVIKTGSGEELANVGTYNTSAAFSISGIPVPLGESVTVGLVGSCAGYISYILSGYYAQP